MDPKGRHCEKETTLARLVLTTHRRRNLILEQKEVIIRRKEDGSFPHKEDAVDHTRKSTGTTTVRRSSSRNGTESPKA